VTPALGGKRLALTIAGFGIPALAAILFTPLVGSTSIDLFRVFDRSIPLTENVDAQIFFISRLPRTLAGALVGATLASAGVVFQGLLRNPLATPFTLGISSGAALGAMLAITYDWTIGIGGVSAVALASFAGSIGAVAIVYALSVARHRGLSTGVLLLAGVTLNAFFSALILFVQYFADFAETFRTIRWLMGDLDVSGIQPIVVALPLAVTAFVLFATLARALNLLSLGPESAGARGIDGPPSSARRSRPGRPCRSAGRSASSASSSRTWSGCSSGPITGWCFRPPRCSVPRFSSAAIRSPGPSCHPSSCPWASSRRS
jgi:iron complex transport system permease protein